MFSPIGFGVDIGIGFGIGYYLIGNAYEICNRATTHMTQTRRGHGSLRVHILCTIAIIRDDISLICSNPAGAVCVCDNALVVGRRGAVAAAGGKEGRRDAKALRISVRLWGKRSAADLAFLMRCKLLCSSIARCRSSSADSASRFQCSWSSR